MWCRIPAVNSIHLSVSLLSFLQRQAFLLPSPSTAITVELPWDISQLSLFRNYPTDVPNGMFSGNQRWPLKHYYRRKEWHVSPLGTSLTIIRGGNVRPLFVYNVLQQREVNTAICICIPSVSKCFDILQKRVPHTKTGRKFQVRKQKISCTQTENFMYANRKFHVSKQKISCTQTENFMYANRKFHVRKQKISCTQTENFM
jgi:hypothetical protein